MFSSQLLDVIQNWPKGVEKFFPKQPFSDAIVKISHEVATKIKSNMKINDAVVKNEVRTVLKHLAANVPVSCCCGWCMKRH